MKSTIFLLLVSLLLVSTSCSSYNIAYHPVDKMNVPENIVYIESDKAVNDSAANIIRNAWNHEDGGMNYIFAENGLECAPFFWKTLAQIDQFKAVQGESRKISYIVEDEPTILEARLFKNIDVIHKLEEYVAGELFADHGFVIRKLEKRELNLFWEMIDYDIKEPIFMLESYSHNFLVHLNDKNEIFYIDDYIGIFSKSEIYGKFCASPATKGMLPGCGCDGKNEGE